MHVEVPAVTARELLRPSRIDARAPAGQERPSTEGASSPGRPGDRHPLFLSGDNSATIRHRVGDVRGIQQQRFVQCASVRTNADMGLSELDAFCRLDLESTALLQKAVESFSLSARAAHRCLRVARTITDLAGVREIALEHVAEAVQYQILERRD